MFSLQLQFRFFRQPTSVSGEDGGLQLRHSSASSTASPTPSSPLTLHGPAGHPSPSHPAPASPAPASGHPPAPRAASDRPGSSAPGPAARGPAPPLLVPGSPPPPPPPPRPGQGPAGGLGDPVRRHRPPPSPAPTPPAPPRSAELVTLPVGSSAGAGVPLGRSHGFPAATCRSRRGDQEAPPLQSAPHQRRAQRPAGGHQKRLELQAEF